MKKIQTKKVEVEEENTNIYFNYLINYTKEEKNKQNYISFLQLFNCDMKEEKISEEVESIILITYCFEEILLNPLRKQNIKLLVISDDGSNNSKTRYEKIDEKTIFFYPRKNCDNLQSIFHPKIFLIKFKNFLRLVIGSPNLFIGDWSCWNNIFYIKNFYINHTNTIIEEKTNFKTSLEKFLKIIFLDQTDELLKNFSNINLDDYFIEENYFNIIYSVPGYFSTEKNNKELTGLHFLSNLIDNNPPKSPYDLNNTTFHYACSSLGSVSINFLHNFLNSIFRFPKKTKDENLSKKKEIKKSSEKEKKEKSDKSLEKKKEINSINNLTNFNSEEKLLDESDIKKNIKNIYIIFPSKEYVEASLASKIAGVPLFFSSQTFYSKYFEKKTLCKYQGKKNFENSEGVLSHCKIFVILKNGVVCDDSIIYLGSHNFSQAAWGRYLLNNKIKVNNYEFGLVLLPKENSKKLKQKILDQINFDIKGDRYKNESPFFRF